MLAFGVCLVSVSYTESYAVTLLLFCICTAAHGAYHSTVVMNPNDILPHHSGLAFGEIYLAFSQNTSVPKPKILSEISNL